jgi:hypothetical protein
MEHQRSGLSYAKVSIMMLHVKAETVHDKMQANPPHALPFSV